MKAANTPRHADSGKLGSTVLATTTDLPQTLLCYYINRYSTVLIPIILIAAKLSNNTIETRRDGQRTRQKHDEEDGRWLRMKRRADARVRPDGWSRYCSPDCHEQISPGRPIDKRSNSRR